MISGKISSLVLIAQDRKYVKRDIFSDWSIFEKLNVENYLSVMTISSNYVNFTKPTVVVREAAVTTLGYKGVDSLIKFQAYCIDIIDCMVYGEFAEKLLFADQGTRLTTLLKHIVDDIQKRLKIIPDSDSNGKVTVPAYISYTKATTIERLKTIRDTHLRVSEYEDDVPCLVYIGGLFDDSVIRWIANAEERLFLYLYIGSMDDVTLSTSTICIELDNNNILCMHKGGMTLSRLRLVCEKNNCKKVVVNNIVDILEKKEVQSSVSLQGKICESDSIHISVANYKQKNSAN